MGAETRAMAIVSTADLLSHLCSGGAGRDVVASSSDLAKGQVLRSSQNSIRNPTLQHVYNALALAERRDPHALQGDESLAVPCMVRATLVS